MKNLNIKQIVLEFFLVGCVANNVFAASVNSSSTIIGRAPLVKNFMSDSNKNSVSIIIYRKDEEDKDDFWHVGDEVYFQFKVVDIDGDVCDGFETAHTVKFGYIADGAWRWVAPTSIWAQDELNWIIPDEAIGSKHLAYMIRPTSSYGAPIANKWIVGYINGGKDPAYGGEGVDIEGKIKDFDPNNVTNSLPINITRSDLPNLPGTGYFPAEGFGPVKKNSN